MEHLPKVVLGKFLCGYKVFLHKIKHAKEIICVSNSIF